MTLKKILVFLAILLVLQELVLRVLFPIPELSNFDRSLYLPGNSEEKKYTYYRNSTWFWESSLDTNFKFVHYLNQYGFRDEEWDLKKPEGKQRILFIGDSFTEGIMAEQEHSLVASVKKSDLKNDLDVMNMGIMGIGLNSYLKMIADAVPAFRPDRVCLMLYSNDLSSKAPVIPQKSLTPEHYNKYLPRLLELIHQIQDGSPIQIRFNKEEKPFLPSMNDKNFPWYKREEVVIKHTSKRVKNSMIDGKVNPFKINQILREKKGLSEQVELEEMMRFLTSYEEKYQTEFVICYLPARHQTTNYYYQFDKEFCVINCPDSLDLTDRPYNQHQEYLKKICAQYQLNFIDFTSVVKQREDAGVHLFWKYDDHMKSSGYQLLGRHLYDSLQLKAI